MDAIVHELHVGCVHALSKTHHELGGGGGGGNYKFLKLIYFIWFKNLHRVLMNLGY